MSRSESLPTPSPPLGPVSWPRRDSVRRAAAVLLTWAAVSAVAGLQAYLAARMGGDPISLGAAWTRHLPILALWALATPFVLASARRFPVRRGGAARALAVHVLFGTLFIVGANLLIRLPGLLPGGAYRGAADLIAGTLAGVVRWYPLALIVYGAIVAVGHGVARDGVEPEPSGAAGDGSAGEAPGTGEKDAPDDPVGPLPLRTGEGIRLLRPEEVEWIEADGNYVVVHCGDGAHRARGRISEFEESLKDVGFARVHRSALVRVARIRELRPLSHGDMEVVLAGGVTVRLSRARRAALEERLGVEL